MNMNATAAGSLPKFMSLPHQKGTTMQNEMILHIKTEMRGSEVSCPMGVTESEWQAMSEDEQVNMMLQYLPNIADWWAAPADNGGKK